MQLSLDEGWAALKGPLLEPLSGASPTVLAAARAAAAQVWARLGRSEEALRLVETLPDALERAPVWAYNDASIGCDAATTMWLLGRTEHLGVIEHNLRDKVLLPDFRFPMRDARLSMGQRAARCSGRMIRKGTPSSSLASAVSMLSSPSSFGDTMNWIGVPWIRICSLNTSKPRCRIAA